MNSLPLLISAIRRDLVVIDDPSVGARKIAPEQRGRHSKVASSAQSFYVGKASGLVGFRIIPELFRLPYQACWFEIDLDDGLIGFLAEDSTDGVAVDLFFLRNDLKKLNVWTYMCTCHVSRQDGCIDVLPVSGVQRTAQSDEYASLAIATLGKFLSALNCTNVLKVENRPPKIKRRMQASKAKLAKYSYWTLQLDLGQMKERQEHGGTHSSPRIHLRRGHVRQYAPGKYTWVQAHVVGDKGRGIVMKDYSAAKGTTH